MFYLHVAAVSNSDVRYILIYRNINTFIQYRDTILAFQYICVGSLTKLIVYLNLPNFILTSI